MATTSAPAPRSCCAARYSSGPHPASTMRPSGGVADRWSWPSTAPADVTPGNVRPGICRGRSTAPTASITLRARSSQAVRSTATQTSKPFVVARDLAHACARNTTRAGSIERRTQCDAVLVFRTKRLAPRGRRRREVAIHLATWLALLVELHHVQTKICRMRRRRHARRPGADDREVAACRRRLLRRLQGHRGERPRMAQASQRAYPPRFAARVRARARLRA